MPPEAEGSELARFRGPRGGAGEEENSMQRIRRLEDRVAELTRQSELQADRIESYQERVAELQSYADSLSYSRTWQLKLSCDRALRSWRGAWQFPASVWRILTRPATAPAGEPAARQLLPQYRPHRRPESRGWPEDRPLITVGVLCQEPSDAMISIGSVLASTLQNIEIIVVDDGSMNAATLRVISGIGNSELKIVRWTESGGPAAFNQVAARGRGKYILLLRAPDLIEPTYLEKTAYILEHFPEYGFCYSRLGGRDSNQVLEQAEEFDLEKALRYPIVPTEALFRREAWAEARGFREVPDYEWNFWVTLGVKGWTGRMIPEPLVNRACEREPDDPGSGVSEDDPTGAPRGMYSYVLAPAPGEPSMSSEDLELRERLAEVSGIDHDALVERAIAEGPAAALRESAEPASSLRIRSSTKKRPGVLFIVHGVDPGGAERLTLQIMRGLADQFSVALVTTLAGKNKWANKFRAVTPAIYHLPNLPVTDSREFLLNLTATHDFKGVILSLSEAGYQALPALRRHPGLWIADIVHNTASEGFVQRSIGCEGWIDQHIAVGEDQAKTLRSSSRSGGRKVSVIPNAVDTREEFNPSRYAGRLQEIRCKLGLAGNEPVLTYSGRLSAEKDIPLFLDSVAEIVRRNPGRRIRSFIVGDGPERLRVEGLIHTKGLKQVVTVLGFYDHPAEILAVSDFVFVTSRYEGTSLTVLEGMSMGLVVMSTEVGNVSEIIEDGVNGVIIRDRGTLGFAEQFGVLDRDRSRAAEIGAAARRTVIERFDLARMLRSYRALLGNALGVRRQAASA